MVQLHVNCGAIEVQKYGWQHSDASLRRIYTPVLRASGARKEKLTRKAKSARGKKLDQRQQKVVYL